MARAHEFYQAAIAAHQRGYRVVPGRTDTRNGAQPRLRVEPLEANAIGHTPSAGEVYVHHGTGAAFSFRGGWRTRDHSSLPDAVNFVIDRRENPASENDPTPRANRAAAASEAAQQRYTNGTPTQQRNQRLADAKSRYEPPEW